MDYTPDSDFLYAIADVEAGYTGCQDVRCGGSIIPTTGGPGASLSATRERQDGMDEYFTWVPARAFYACSCYDEVVEP